MNQHFFGYTDVSYSPQKKEAVSGYCLIESLFPNPEAELTPNLVQTVFFREKNNIRAELRGVFHLFKAFELLVGLKPGCLTVYTDCQSILRLEGRRGQLETSGYVSKRRGIILPNTDLYQEFFRAMDRHAPRFALVQGHKPAKDRTLIEKNFSLVDRRARRELRRGLKG